MQGLIFGGQFCVVSLVKSDDRRQRRYAKVLSPARQITMKANRMANSARNSKQI
jgi:hypothetical protein